MLKVRRDNAKDAILFESMVICEYLDDLGGGTLFPRSGAQRHMNTGYILGSRMPAQLSTAGMAILAGLGECASEAWLAARTLQAYTPFTLATQQAWRDELQRFSRQGWAILEQQLELNTRGIAVPLLDRHNGVHGAISITMPINQESQADALARVLPALQEAARGLRPLL